MNNTPEKISVLIPSRGRPLQCRDTITNLLYYANHSEQVEVIVHLQHDDPVRSDYLRCLPEGVVILSGLPLGYLGMGTYLDRCFQKSSGDILWALADDVEVQTKGWDTIVREKMLDPFSVGACVCDEGLYNTLNYPWAYPFISRLLSLAIGHFAPGEVAYDRVCEHYHLITGKGVQLPITLSTQWQLPLPGSDREKWYNYTRSHWTELSAMWHEEAQLWAARVTGKL